MNLIVIGFNYKKSSLAVREAVAFDRARSIELSKKLVSQDVIGEGLVLSTCNRMEVYLASPCVEGAIETVYQTISEITGVGVNELRDTSYSFFGVEALKHIFRVASSLDALVVGEAQVLGQFKSAYQASAEYETAGPYLHKVCHSAFRVAKRVRTETTIAELSVSVGTLAVEMIEDHHKDLDKATVFVIGAGEMGELVATRLKDRGASHIWITNRTKDRAETLARKVNGVAIPFEQWELHLSTADIIVTSAGGGNLINRSRLESAYQKRGGRDLLIVDLAVPRNVEEASIAGVKVYNIDDLQNLADKNLASRKGAALKAEEIVEDEAVTVFNELGHLKLAPILKKLTDKCESVISKELEHMYADHPNFSSEDKKAIEQCTGLIVKKILHNPIVSVKEELAKPNSNGAEISKLLGRIFDV